MSKFTTMIILSLNIISHLRLHLYKRIYWNINLIEFRDTFE